MIFRLLAPLIFLLMLSWTPSLVQGQQIPVYQWPDKLNLCGERVPFERQDVWEMMDQAFVSSVYNQPRVILWIKRAHRYFPYLERRLRERKLPDDLKYVVVVESALKTYATSSAKAVGPWQFIEGTGKRYGLRNDRWIDERYHFERATEAAMSYLSDLYKEFGSWPLAIAAYNCGENRMAKDLKAQRVSNFYDADLPLETEGYIFSILAAKAILSNAAAYGYSIPATKRYPPLEYDEIDLSVNHELPITAVAHACDTTYKIIKEMNPELRQNALPSGHVKIRIPKGKAQGFNARLTKELSR